MSKVKKPVEKVEAKDVSKKDNEPSWYHYLLVLLIFAGVVGVFWVGYVFFVEDNDSSPSGPIMYKYVYKVGNVTYNLYFESQISELDKMDVVIEPSKYDVLNTVNFMMAFLEYNGSDNGQIAKGSTKLTSFLKFVYSFNFGNESFLKIDEISCENSTRKNKVIVFDPYQNVTGIFMDENGCIEFVTDDPKKMVGLVDKFIYEMTLGEKSG